jgi:hypothetical protein
MAVAVLGPREPLRTIGLAQLETLVVAALVLQRPFSSCGAATERLCTIPLVAPIGFNPRLLEVVSSFLLEEETTQSVAYIPSLLIYQVTHWNIMLIHVAAHTLLEQISFIVFI